MDARDKEILAQRQAAYDALTEPLQGDFIVFPDGSEARITHVWRDENHNPEGIQTSDGPTYGSFYLADGYLSYSGGLNPPLPFSAFTLTDEKRLGWVWFFHHDYPQAHNGIDVQLVCKVWHCTEENKTHANWLKAQGRTKL